MRQGFNLFDRDIAPGCGAGRIPSCRFAQKFFCTAGVACDVIRIQHAVTLQNVRDAVRQSRISSRAQGDVVMAFFDAVGNVRIYRPQDRALAFGLLNLRPQMHMAGDRIAPPNHNQLRATDGFGIHPDTFAHAQLQPRATCRCANRALQQTCAQCMKKPSGHAFALHLPHGAGIAVRENAFRITPPDFGQALRNGCIGFVPRYRRELSAAFFADPLERRGQSTRMVAALGISTHLGAQRSRSQ